MAEKLGKVVLEGEFDDSKINAGIDKTKEKATGLAGTFGKVSGAGRILTGVVGTVVGAISENSGASWDELLGKVSDENTKVLKKYGGAEQEER